MTLLTMKRTLFNLFLLIVASLTTPVWSAPPPRSLELRASGTITLVADNLPGIEIRTEAVETSEDTWKAPVSLKPTEEQSGDKVVREWAYRFPEGSEVKGTTTATIQGNDVITEAAWPTESQERGFLRMDLWLPPELASDCTVELEGAPIVVDMNKSAFSPGVGEYTFRRTSTGEFLFKVIAEVGNIHWVVNPEAPETGLTMRIFNLENYNRALISDATGLNWTLSFKE